MLFEPSEGCLKIRDFAFMLYKVWYIFMQFINFNFFLVEYSSDETCIKFCYTYIYIIYIYVYVI